jgi:hypothetical protein
MNKRLASTVHDLGNNKKKKIKKQKWFGLYNDMIQQVMCFLDNSTILTLRLVSKDTLAWIHSNMEWWHVIQSRPIINLPGLHYGNTFPWLQYTILFLAYHTITLPSNHTTTTTIDAENTNTLAKDTIHLDINLITSSVQTELQLLIKKMYSKRRVKDRRGFRELLFIKTALPHVPKGLLKNVHLIDNDHEWLSGGKEDDDMVLDFGTCLNTLVSSTCGGDKSLREYITSMESYSIVSRKHGARYSMYPRTATPVNCKILYINECFPHTKHQVQEIHYTRIRNVDKNILIQQEKVKLYCYVAVPKYMFTWLQDNDIRLGIIQLLNACKREKTSDSQILYKCIAYFIPAISEMFHLYNDQDLLRLFLDLGYILFIDHGSLLEKQDCSFYLRFIPHTSKYIYGAAYLNIARYHQGEFVVWK